MTINLTQDEVEALLEMLNNAKDEAVQWNCAGEARMAEQLIAKLEKQIP